ncbi:hypothetical protein ACVWXN_002791 [Bradyrhizobium sp. i1.4.4]
MFKQFLLVAAIASLTLATSSKADCEYALERGASAESRSVSLHSDAAQLAEALLDDIVTWLSSNFDLPAIKQRPVVEFASKMELARLRARDRTSSQGFMESDGQLAQREVVALYDNETRTILLPDDLGRHFANRPIGPGTRNGPSPSECWRAQICLPTGAREVGLPGSG